MGSFTVSGQKYDVHGGYITVPAMHTLKGKRHLIEIGLTGSSGGKKATYTVFGTNDEVSMDHKFLGSLGWEGLEQEGKLGSLGIGTIFAVPGETNPEELAEGT